ncbi:MAG TPA: aminoglycoside adenylyltransferase domain-containing protein [Candidatus Limnocylindria bacterium]|nr:aminoglycoside adenylyltransferase domain-containing protein [Candidatus Limnocylindria bacterium]
MFRQEPTQTMEKVSPADDAWAFGQEVAAVLDPILADDFVGAWFVGSLALGGYVRGESDIDIVGVCRRPIRKETKHVLAEQLLEATTNCPARGLEFSLYRAEVASAPGRHADFEVNVNGGPRMARSVHLAARHEPGFWYAIDRAIAHRQGLAISGPPGAEVFADLPRDVLLDAMGESMRWHREHEKATLYSVLNAGRAWRFAIENVLGSKLDGARWARERWRTPSLMDAAVDLRHGHPAHLDAGEVDEFLEHVEQVLALAA